MKPLNDRIKVEIDNIDTVINELKEASKKEEKSNLEISGTGALLHSFYSGIENILKQIFIEYKFSIPNDLSWHKTLLTEAVENKISLKNIYLLGIFLYIHILLCLKKN